MRPKTVSELLRNCASSDTHRLMLCGIAEDSGDDGVFRVATDTHRLIAVKIGEPTKERYSKLIYPEEFANTKGAYPDWRRVVPGESTRSVCFMAEPLVAAIQCAMVAGKHNARRIKFKFSDNSCEVYGRSEELGTARFDLASLDRDNIVDFEVALNGSYLLDMIPKVDCEDGRIMFSFTESSRPAIITYPGYPDLWKETRAVIMPMALA